jgi:hypothetical protein
VELLKIIRHEALGVHACICRKSLGGWKTSVGCAELCEELKVKAALTQPEKPAQRTREKKKSESSMLSL